MLVGFKILVVSAIHIYANLNIKNTNDSFMFTKFIQNLTFIPKYKLTKLKKYKID